MLKRALMLADKGCAAGQAASCITVAAIRRTDGDLSQALAASDKACRLALAPLGPQNFRVNAGCYAAIKGGKDYPELSSLAALVRRPSHSIRHAKVIPSIALEKYRTRGTRSIAPPEVVKRAMAAAGKEQLVATIKVCVRETGDVAAVEVLRSSSHTAYDEALLRGLWDSRFSPFVHDGKATPVCTAFTYIFRFAE